MRKVSPPRWRAETLSTLTLHNVCLAKDAIEGRKLKSPSRNDIAPAYNRNRSFQIFLDGERVRRPDQLEEEVKKSEILILNESNRGILRIYCLEKARRDVTIEFLR